MSLLFLFDTRDKYGALIFERIVFLEDWEDARFRSVSS